MRQSCPWSSHKFALELLRKLGGSESDDLQKIIIQITESERMLGIPQYEFALYIPSGYTGIIRGECFDNY